MAVGLPESDSSWIMRSDCRRRLLYAQVFQRQEARPEQQDAAEFLLMLLGLVSRTRARMRCNANRTMKHPDHPDHLT